MTIRRGAEHQLRSACRDVRLFREPVRLRGGDGHGLGCDRCSPTNRSAQVTIVGNDDMAAPGISVEVADVDAVHARAVEQGHEIAYPMRDEEWGVRRFMLRDPSGTIVNVLSHRSE